MENNENQLNTEDQQPVCEPNGAQGEQNTPALPEQPAAEPQIFSAKRNKWDKAVNLILWVIIAVLVAAVFLRAFVFGKITVSGTSMLQTYQSGEVVTVNKLAKPKRGQVAVFYKYPIDSKLKAMFASGEDISDDGKYVKLIKRVVALEGDKLWTEKNNDGSYSLVVQTAEGEILRENYYTRNGKPLSEEAFRIHDAAGGVICDRGRLASATKAAPYVVSEGCFFAMGDNRDISADSRGTLGDVPFERVYGIVM